MSAVEDINTLDQIKEAPDKSPAEPPPEEPFAVALREKIRAMADDPLTVKSARQIGMFAAGAAKLMKIVGKGPLPTRRRSSGLWNPGGMEDEDLLDPVALGNGMPVISPLSNPAETFGSTVVRQAIAAYREMEKSKKRSPVALIRAISEARKAGLDDIAEELTVKLRQIVETAKDEPTSEILQVDSKPDGSGEPQITEAMAPTAVATAGELVDHLRDELDDMAAMEAAEAAVLNGEPVAEVL